MRKRRKLNIILILFVVILLFGLGYAYLTTTLSINGTTDVDSNTWNIYWDNVEVTTGSVAADTPVIDTNKTTVTFNVHLSKPGDFYEFTVDVKNAGTIDAMIDTVTSTLNGSNITTLPNYLNYIVTYSDDIEIKSKQELLSGTKETYKIRVEYKKDINPSDLPTTDQNLSLSFKVTYIQKDETSILIPRPDSFSTDSWDTIIGAVRANNTSKYNLGDTKTVSMGLLGTHTLRIANKSTPSDCNNSNFSQTACGFVLEFADLLPIHRINPFAENPTSIGIGSKGGWESSDMRAYVNSTYYLKGTSSEINYTNGGVYNNLPAVIKNSIIDTTVVSGHGSGDSTNFTTIDKLYLLSAHEVWKDVDGNNNSGINYYDSAYNNTRQLDYYEAQGVTSSSYAGATKQNNGSIWWLRTPSSRATASFMYVYRTGYWDYDTTDITYGVSPAFRIG